MAERLLVQVTGGRLLVSIAVETDERKCLKLEMVLRRLVFAFKSGAENQLELQGC